VCDLDARRGCLRELEFCDCLWSPQSVLLHALRASALVVLTFDSDAPHLFDDEVAVGDLGDAGVAAVSVAVSCNHYLHRMCTAVAPSRAAPAHAPRPRVALQGIGPACCESPSQNYDS
jgi:hypothetical protein